MNNPYRIKAMQVLQIENKAARLKLNESVHKESMDRIVEEIGRVFGATAAQNGVISGDITNFAENAADTLDIEIHSPGGSVLDGYTLYNAITEMRERGVYVTAYVTLAASMASVIAMAADKVVMLKGSRMMIHEASAGTQGDAEEHRNRAELLEGISDEIAGIYAERTGMDKKNIRKMMKKETWMDAKTAVELKFADEAFDNQKKNKAMNLIDRLQNPSDAEAKAQIEALNSQIATNEELVNELQAKVESVSSDLEAAATELLEIKSAKETAEAKAIEFETKAQELEAKVAELEAKGEVSEEKIAAKASEILANQGHPIPVAIEDDGGSAKSHLETFESLTGSEATAYYKAHGKEIRAQLRNR